jgi:methionyl-tRNA formyltransferase
MSRNSRIVVLTVPSPHAWIVINAIAAKFGPVTILAEDPQSRRELIKQRMRRQGIITVAGQIGFVLLRKLLDRFGGRRVNEIIAEHGLNPRPNPSCPLIEIESVNSQLCRDHLRRLDPKVVFVQGTRIIRRETLRCIPAPFVNYHAGLTPKYRGQAGGYWALAMGDAEHAGVTVHLVDRGVDTGGILYQAPFTATHRDNFSTYFYLQAAIARGLVRRALEDALVEKLRPQTSALPSQQFYHPTLWFYLKTALTKGVW